MDIWERKASVCAHTCISILDYCMCIHVCKCDERAKQLPTVYLMTLIPLRQPIRALGVSRRPALATRYLPNMCRGLLPSPINSPRMEGRRDGETEAWKGIRGKNNSPNYNSQGVGGNNGAYRERGEKAFRRMSKRMRDFMATLLFFSTYC